MTSIFPLINFELSGIFHIFATDIHEHAIYIRVYYDVKLTKDNTNYEKTFISFIHDVISNCG